MRGLAVYEGTGGRRGDWRSNADTAPPRFAPESPKVGAAEWWVWLTGPAARQPDQGVKRRNRGRVVACSRHSATSIGSLRLLRILENLAAVFREAPTLECTNRKFLKGHSPPYIAGGTRRLLSRYGSICHGSRDGDDRGDNGDLDDTRTARAQNLHASLVHLDFLPWLMFLLSFFTIAADRATAKPPDDAYFRSAASLATKLSSSTRSGVERH